MTEQVRAFVARFHWDDYDNSRNWVVFYPGQPYALVYHDEDGMPSTISGHAHVMTGERSEFSGLRCMVPIVPAQDMEEAAASFLEGGFTRLPLDGAMEAIELPLVRPWREQYEELLAAMEDTLAAYVLEMATEDANLHVVDRESEEWAAAVVHAFGARSNMMQDWTIEDWREWSADVDKQCGWCVNKADKETGMCAECTQDVRARTHMDGTPITRPYPWWPHTPTHQPV